MSITVEAEGTQTASIGTEHTLAQSAVGKVLTLVVSLKNMQNNDIVELRVYGIVLTTGAQELVYGPAVYSDVQTAAVKTSIPWPNIAISNAFKATLKQTAGTG